jgi:hypothetical protein
MLHMHNVANFGEGTSDGMNIEISENGDLSRDATAVILHRDFCTRYYCGVEISMSEISHAILPW